MEKFAPCLWFDQNAREAVDFYSGLFPDSHTDAMYHYLEGAHYEGPPMPKGTELNIRFTLCGQEFNALNGGPIFKFNPAVSLYVSCADEEEFDRLWAAFVHGGSVMMEAGEYPFSKKYGWLADRFGLSWQLSVDEQAQKITPYLLFVGDVYGKAEEAMAFYASAFGRGEIKAMQKYGLGTQETEGSVMFAQFALHGQRFMAADSGYSHAFAFNEAVSFMVYCDDQAEMDGLWACLTSDGGQEQPCGWVKDKFGVSWQMASRDIDKWMDDSDPVRAARVNDALMKMTKIDLSVLRAAYEGV